MPQVKQRENNRAIDLLDAAARLFADQGYHRTTIRDITSSVGMGPGSSYYHFSSKADMLRAVYTEGVRSVTESVLARLADESDPWERLALALEGHIEAVLTPTAYARVIVSVLPDDVPDVAGDLRLLRDGYELLWKELINDLDALVDAELLRLFLLGAANATQIWYRAGDLTPSDIAAGYVSFLRQPLEQS